MKIKKGILGTLIEFTPREFLEMRSEMTDKQYAGLVLWIDKTFGLDLCPKLKEKK